MIDKYLMDQLDAVLSQLPVPVTVLDKTPDSMLYSDRIAEIRDLTDGVCQHVDGTLYLPITQPPLVLACDASIPNSESILLLAAALVNSLGAVANRPENGYDVYRRILLGELTGSELDALAQEHQLPYDLNRCAMIFHITQADKHTDKAYAMLSDITPLQERDVLLEMDRHTVLLIKDVHDLTDAEGMEDIIQFAQALQETLMSETAVQMTVGIGRAHHTLHEIRESYLEARRAIEIGRVFQPEASVYEFDRLILERFLTELPADISAHYHALLFNRKTARLFNEEMLYTIDMFFKKDLNLSDTARQLYIHRNTLVYRLDKVQRQTGLDLRKFEDAVTFKLLMELKKCSGNKLANQ